MVEILQWLPWRIPPWVIISGLAGLIAAASFFVVAGRGLRSLPTYLLLSLLVAPLVQLTSEDLPHVVEGLVVGEVDLLLVILGTWIFLFVARLLRL